MSSLSRIPTLLALLALVAAARAEEPDAVVRETSAQLLARLEADAERIRSDGDYLLALLDDLLVPRVDARAAARLVLQQHWQEATEEQRGRFAEEFLRYLLRFYAQVFRAHAGESPRIDYEPAELSSDGRIASVRSTLHASSGEPTVVRYRLRRSGEDWRVMDVIIDGVSLVETNRSQFASLIRRDGLEAVIAQLAERNARPLR